MNSVTDPVLRERLSRIRERLERGLDQVDPHHRLQGRPVAYKVIAGQTFEIIYQEVPRIGDAEVDGIKRLVGEACYCSVLPRTSETLTVRFVVPLTTGD
jgi:hypothetical protein